MARRRLLRRGPTWPIRRQLACREGGRRPIIALRMLVHGHARTAGREKGPRRTGGGSFVLSLGAPGWSGVVKGGLKRQSSGTLTQGSSVDAQPRVSSMNYLTQSFYHRAAALSGAETEQPIFDLQRSAARQYSR
jgi:hypothetical protein